MISCDFSRQVSSIYPRTPVKESVKTVFGGLLMFDTGRSWSGKNRSRIMRVHERKQKSENIFQTHIKLIKFMKARIENESKELD